MAELLRVKRSLAREAESVTRMQIRNSVNPKTAYANPPAQSLLLSMVEMEDKILALQKKTADQDNALKEERETRHETLKAQRQAQEAALKAQRQAQEAALKAEREAREEAVKAQRQAQEAALKAEREAREEAVKAEREAREEAVKAEREAREEAVKAEREIQQRATEALCRITKEVMMLRPLKATAIDIRQRFFATFRRGQHSREVDDHLIIDCGNLQAHAGDVVLDVCLFKNHEICSEDTFSILYGVSWRQAEQLLGMRVYSPTSTRLFCSSNRDRQ